ncbi:MAG: ROK family transcriptional regulator [Angustibacter sp.]
MAPTAYRDQRGTGVTQESVRRHNLATVLSHVHLAGQLSRAELTARMGLNRSTIAGLVGELVELGAVLQAPPGERVRRPGAGRPSLDVRPNADTVYVVAVDVGVDVLRVARVGLGGQVLHRVSGRTPPSHRPAAVAGAAVQLVRVVVDAAPPAAALVGIGVGVPGVVRERDGVVRFAPNLGWREVPFAGLLESRMRAPVPVHVANDADLGVLAEHIRGAAVGRDDVVFLMGDVGLGGGVIAGGRPLHGAGGYAGELGHLQVNPRGRDCQCGSRGCWETEVGASAIARALRAPDSTVEALTARLAQVRRPSPALRTVGRYLGIGLGNVVNLLNPETLVLGGVFRALLPAVRDATLEALAGRALAVAREQVQVVVPALGGDAVLIGAAERSFQPVIADPVPALAGACRDAVAAVTAPSGRRS